MAPISYGAGVDTGRRENRVRCNSDGVVVVQASNRSIHVVIHDRWRLFLE